MAASSTPDEALQRCSVAVLYGGRSSERDVSLVSGVAIQRALVTADAGDDRGPARVVPVSIEPDGRWRVESNAAESPDAAIRRASVDVWFLGLHGGEGEDGHVQALLAALGQAHTGTDTRGSAIAMDKGASLALARRAGLNVPRGTELHREQFTGSLEPSVVDALRGTNGWFVKPVNGGSSVGAGPATTLSELESRVARAFEFDPRVLIEESIQGTEATVAVLDLVGSEPRALPAVEIRPHAGKFFDYEEKYSESGAEEICPPESFSPEVRAQLADAALRAHRALRASSYSRADFLVRDEEVVFLELNTLPGFTPRSLVPREALAVGLDFRSLCLALTADGLARGVRR